MFTVARCGPTNLKAGFEACGTFDLVQAFRFQCFTETNMVDDCIKVETYILDTSVPVVPAGTTDGVSMII